MIRKTDQINDTFFIALSEPKINEMENYQNLISSIEFETEIEKDKYLTISVFKQYPAEYLSEHYEKFK